MIIRFDARLIKALDVSCSEFMLLAFISMPEWHDEDGYYILPRRGLAYDLNLTREATIKMINRLDVKNLIIKNEANSRIKVNINMVDVCIAGYNSTRHPKAYLRYYGK